MMKSILTLAVACAGLTGLCGPAFAAPSGFCGLYAREAVHEVEVSIGILGCFKGFDARWNRSFERHYNWCLGASFAAINAERNYRRARLAECRAQAGN